MKIKYIPIFIFLFAFYAGNSFSQTIIRTIACNGIGANLGDSGSAILASCGLPTGVAVDSAGNVFFTDQYFNVIRKVTPSGYIYRVAGIGYPAYNGIGIPALSATVQVPMGIIFDAAGNLIFSDNGNALVRKIDTFGIISNVAGRPGVYGYCCDGGPATNAIVSNCDICMDTSGNMLIADGNSRVRKVNPSGIITTIAGTSLVGFSSGCLPATSPGVAMDGIFSVAGDRSGNIYLSDQSNTVIRKINTAGIMCIFAGNGSFGLSGDNGPAISAKLYSPAGVKVDHAGNVYIADMTNARIRMVDTGGIIHTVVGTSAGWAGDGGPPTACKISPIQDFCFDVHGNMFIADIGGSITSPGGHRIREVLRFDTMHITVLPGDTVCSGDSALFSVHYTQSPLYGAVYQWRLNGGNVGTNSPVYVDHTVNTGDVIKCYIMDTTGHFPIAVSDSVVMTVVPVVTPSLTVVSSGDTVCAGLPVTLTASSVNGGAVPFYQWKVFSVDTATGAVFSYIPHNGDIVTCTLISTAVCARPDTVVKSMTMTVNPSYHPTVAIHPFPVDTLHYLGQIITLFTDVTFGGSHPIFKWYRNGVHIPGDDSSSYFSMMYSTDTFYTVLISNAPCVVPFTDTSAPVIISLGTLGVNNFAGSNSELSIIPNPNSGMFTLKLPVGYSVPVNVTVKDVTGRIVYINDLINLTKDRELTIALPVNLPTGVYFLFAEDDLNKKVVSFTLKK